MTTFQPVLKHPIPSTGAHLISEYHSLIKVLLDSAFFILGVAYFSAETAPEY
jgi:hypothetical protein